jgi:DNA-binding winged helix-turn-helix (wHTH) protein/TolB-like protein/Tfp pilus assembly protein PilF
VGEVTSSKREVYRFGPYRLDVPSRRLTCAGEAISLPLKAFELLVILLRNSDRAVRRTELLDSVWRDTVVEEGSLGWNMSVLRKALDRTEEEVIETVRGFGYRLALPVVREEDTAGTPAEPPVPEPVALNTDRESGSAEDEPEIAPVESAAGSEASRAPTVSRWRGSRLAVTAVVATIALAALGLALWGLRARQPGETTGAPPDASTTLAVLPFENLAGRPDEAWISMALAEILSSELTLGREATTVPQESVARAVEEIRPRSGGGLSPGTLSRLRERLGLDLVVVGSYLVTGQPATLRVDLRLQDAADGSTRFAWSETRPAADLLSLTSNAGAALRGQLSHMPSRSLSAERVGFRAPPPALRAYTEGLELRRRFELAAARRKLEEAVTAAPDFVVARAALADLLAELGYERDAISESRRALAGAGALTPIERLPIEAKNRELEARWGEAVTLRRELVRLDPGSLEHGLALARALSRAGEHTEARATLAELARRLASSGSDPRIELERGWAERYAQDLPAMEAAGLRAMAIGRRQHSDYVLVEALALVAWADLSLGKYQTGLDACTEGQRIAQAIGHRRLQTLNSSLCGWIHSSLGHSQQAVRQFRTSLRLAEQDGNAIYQSGALLALGWLSVGQGRLTEAAGEAEKALALARNAGDREREVNSLELVTHIAYERADLEGAEAAAVEALAKAREINVASRIATHLGYLGVIRLVRGDYAAALSAHEEAVRVNPLQSADRMATLEIELAQTRLEMGDAAEAVALCNQVERRLRSAAMPDLQRLYILASRGRAQAALGHIAAAREDLRQLDRYRAALADPVLGVQTQLQRAMLLAAVGEDAAAERAWRAILGEPSLRELELYRRIASYELAKLVARSSPSAKTAAQLAEARRLAREAKLGFLLDEKL